eukprot:scaffold82449_cov64-Phaeocystis_antarctica.AAC.5
MGVRVAVAQACGVSVWSKVAFKGRRSALDRQSRDNARAGGCAPSGGIASIRSFSLPQFPNKAYTASYPASLV